MNDLNMVNDDYIFDFCCKRRNKYEVIKECKNFFDNLPEDTVVSDFNTDFWNQEIDDFDYIND